MTSGHHPGDSMAASVPNPFSMVNPFLPMQKQDLNSNYGIELPIVNPFYSGPAKYDPMTNLQTTARQESRHFTYKDHQRWPCDSYRPTITTRFDRSPDHGYSNIFNDRSPDQEYSNIFNDRPHDYEYSNIFNNGTNDHGYSNIFNDRSPDQEYSNIFNDRSPDHGYSTIFNNRTNDRGYSNIFNDRSNDQEYSNIFNDRPHDYKYSNIFNNGTNDHGYSNIFNDRSPDHGYSTIFNNRTNDRGYSNIFNDRSNDQEYSNIFKDRSNDQEYSNIFNDRSNDHECSSIFNSPRSFTGDENHCFSLQNENVAVCQPKSESAETSSSNTPEMFKEYLGAKPFESIEDKATKSFRSEDKQENRDNDPSRWEFMKRLGTDEERRNFARRQFSNPHQVDPTSSTTYFGLARLFIAKKFGIQYEPNGGVDQVFLREGKLELLDDESHQGEMPVSRKRRRETDHFSSKRFRLINFNDFQKEMFFKMRDVNYPRMYSGCQTPITNSYQRACTAKKKCEQCRKRQHQNWLCYLRHFKAGMEERKTFIKLYRQDAEDPMDHIPEIVLERSIQAEKMFKEFRVHYGENQEDRCSKCKTSHIS